MTRNYKSIWGKNRNIQKTINSKKLNEVEKDLKHHFLISDMNAHKHAEIYFINNIQNYKLSKMKRPFREDLKCI